MGCSYLTIRNTGAVQVRLGLTTHRGVQRRVGRHFNSGGSAEPGNCNDLPAQQRMIANALQLSGQLCVDRQLIQSTDRKGLTTEKLQRSNLLCQTADILKSEFAKE